MEDRGRVVVVAAGFALWAGGRCAAAARWSDVARLRARHCAFPPTDALSLVVELVDGSTMELHEEAPGFSAFLDRAAVTLSGLVPYMEWHAALAASAGGDVVVFQRNSRR
jgi:hypothetical protein